MDCPKLGNMEDKRLNQDGVMGIERGASTGSWNICGVVESFPVERQ